VGIIFFVYYRDFVEMEWRPQRKKKRLNEENMKSESDSECEWIVGKDKALQTKMVPWDYQTKHLNWPAVSLDRTILNMYNSAIQIGQGTNENQFTGNLIDIGWITWSFTLENLQTGDRNPEDVLIRCMVFIDHQAKGGPFVTPILTSDVVKDNLNAE